LIADCCEWLTGQTIAQWQAARDAIKTQNERDRAQRTV
jgi:hypothetical protein